MADKKISELTGATTPLAGTEVLPIVQSGSTVKVAVSNLTAGRSVSASTVLIPGNNTGITTGDPNNIVRFTDTDTTAAAGQPMGRIEWVSSDASFEGVKGYIQVEATDGTPDGDMFFATQHNTGAGLAKRLKIQYDGDVNVLTGNLVFGTAGKGMTGGTVVTTTGQTSVPDSTATTIFALPSTTRVCSLQVFCNVLDAPASNSYVVIVYDRTNARIAVNGNDADLVISLSGSNVQVTQTFGTTQAVDWGYILSKNA